MSASNSRWGRSVSNYVQEQTLQSRIEALEKRLFQMEQARRLESSSIQNGSQAVYDDAGVIRVRFGKQTDDSYGAWFFDPADGSVRVRVGELGDGSFGIGILDGTVPQWQGDEVSATQTTTSTSFTDLATVGPQIVNVYIGSTRRCLVLVKADALNNATSDYAHMKYQVSGASSIGPVSGVSGGFVQNGSANITRVSVAGFDVLTAADGLNQGLNTFTAKYRSGVGGVAEFGSRKLIVLPF